MAVRVTRQVVEVLGVETNLEPSVESTLSLSHTAKQLANQQSASSVLDLTQEVEDNTKPVSVQSELSLTQAATNNIKFASASNALSLSHTVVKGEDKLESLTSVLSLIDFANQNQKEQSVSSLLNLQQDIVLITNNDVLVNVESNLNLTQDASVGNFVFNRNAETSNLELFLNQDIQLTGTRNLSIASILNLVQAISINKTLNLSLESFISLSQQAGRIFNETGASVLDIQQLVERIFAASSVMDITHAVVLASSRDASNQLDLTHTVNIISTFVRVLTSALGLSHSVAVRKAIISDCFYDPQVGTANSGITPPSTVAPTFGNATLTLTYPFVTPTSTLVLRNPIFGNTERKEYSRINRESRGGTLLIFRDPKWPKREVLQVTVEALSEQQKLDLLQFFQDSLGKEIGLLDDENNQWKGVIIDPDADVTHVGFCDYSVTFQFEGEIQ